MFLPLGRGLDCALLFPIRARSRDWLSGVFGGLFVWAPRSVFGLPRRIFVAGRMFWRSGWEYERSRKRTTEAVHNERGESMPL